MDYERARQIIAKFNQARVAVVGDLILDRYMLGTASRISFEAPVPVVRVQEHLAVLGGAANVMRNITSLGARALAFGVVGTDESADAISELLADRGIDGDGILALKDRQTTVKTRVIADHQQVVRIDDETCSPLSPRDADELLERLRGAFVADQIDAVILEDYNKGVLTPELARTIQQMAAAAGAICLLDPHPANPLQVENLTLMTPNRVESFALAGEYFRELVLPIEQDEALHRVAEKLMAAWSPENLLITLGAGGMALFGADGLLHHIPTVAREVFDVSGAGDTVIATCALAMLAGAEPAEAAALANHAGGVVVGKIGTVSVEIEELLASFRAEDDE